MVLIWQGRGIVVLFLFILASAIGITLAIVWIAPVLGISRDERIINLGIGVGTLLSAAATYPLGRFLMKPKPTQVDTLCFVDVRYWPHIFIALTVVMLVVVIFF